ncbi:MAG TPA: PEFG-CTERM sorting domain-containing protein [Candidatus Nitrosotalea sp.]|jgi:predicted secreted protein with PEFG-CTERM motif|nr:PEFG-CTERM sorting domain-containing protein [Candidatus Nitrosotalea sp.]HET7337575.1 PEFG-CTERM sorting domain-containing protein [Candidatus Nitrosotalea sp.]
MLKIAIVAAIVILLAPMASSSFAQEYKTFPGVGKDAGDGTTTFDVQYSSVKDIVSASVSVKDKSVDFVLAGKTDTNSTLILKLPKGLINGFIGVFVDGQIVTNYTTTDETGDTLVSIPITPLTENISIVGTSVVPEFGPIAAIVLAIAITSIVAVTRLRPIHL